jgi:hypothetical protein
MHVLIHAACDAGQPAPPTDLVEMIRASRHRPRARVADTGCQTIFSCTAVRADDLPPAPA